MRMLFALLLAACSAPAVPEMLQPPPSRLVLSAVGAGATEPACRILYGRTSCQWSGPNPVVVPRALPRVGDELVVRWQLSVVPPAPALITPDGVTVWPEVVLLASTRPLAAPLPAGGAAPGCWLLVEPDILIVPQIESWLAYDRAAGAVTMRWVPVAGQEGQDLYCQLVVMIPTANPLGMISSAGLHLRVGSAR